MPIHTKTEKVIMYGLRKNQKRCEKKIRYPWHRDNQLFYDNEKQKRKHLK